MMNLGKPYKPIVNEILNHKADKMNHIKGKIQDVAFH